jgi:hypothetical protein
MNAIGLIGGVAGVSQLVAYGHTATKYLIKLYKAVRDGPTAFQDQRYNISLLLNITEQICRRNSSQNESILSLFVQITDTVHSIVKLLEQRGILGINWILVTNTETLAQAFESLNRKRDLLQLHLSQESHELLSRIQVDITSMSRRDSNLPQAGQGDMGNKTSKVDEKVYNVKGKAESIELGLTAIDFLQQNIGEGSNSSDPQGNDGKIQIEVLRNISGEKAHQNIADGLGPVFAKGAGLKFNVSGNQARRDSNQNIANYSSTASKK